jgi:hypothetical protein
MRAVVFFFLLAPALLGPMGCAGAGGGARRPASECLDSEIQRIRNAPATARLTTLDGRQVPLADLFDRCSRMFPFCVLAETFPHWRREVRQVESRTPGGTVRHPVRIYHNPVSVCSPAASDPGRTLGDVAEIYDPQGGFLGLAVYMGDGQYAPLPVTGALPVPAAPALVLPRGPE